MVATRRNSKHYEQRHPSKIAEEGATPYEILTQELLIAESWDAFTSMYAFSDLLIYMDECKTASYQQLVSMEDLERQKLPGYKSDAWMKGRLSMLADLKNYMAGKIDQQASIREQLEAYKEMNQE